MRSTLILIGMLFLAGCASAPAKKLMKNCEQAGKGSDLYYCEEIPERQVERRR